VPIKCGKPADGWCRPQRIELVERQWMRVQQQTPPLTYTHTQTHYEHPRTHAHVHARHIAVTLPASRHTTWLTNDIYHGPVTPPEYSKNKQRLQPAAPLHNPLPHSCRPSSSPLPHSYHPFTLRTKFTNTKIKPKARTDPSLPIQATTKRRHRQCAVQPWWAAWGWGVKAHTACRENNGGKAVWVGDTVG